MDARENASPWLSTRHRLRRLLRRRGRRVRWTAKVFHRDWYDSNVWNGGVTWEGILVLKNPLDMWMYQELLFQTRPELIVETGTNRGGSALFFARLQDIYGHGSVVSVDVTDFGDRPAHPRIQYVTASSTAKDTVGELRELASASRSTMVVLDSDHSEQHVAEELRLLAPLVTQGQYLVVEDTNINGHPARKSHGPGPMEAVRNFLNDPACPFVVDERMERFVMTFNPHGWLRRIR